jgi:hypothetical protein
MARERRANAAQQGFHQWFATRLQIVLSVAGMPSGRKAAFLEQALVGRHGLTFREERGGKSLRDLNQHGNA